MTDADLSAEIGPDELAPEEIARARVPQPAWVVDAYAAETGLPIERVLKMLPLLEERLAFDRTRLTPAEREEDDELSRRFQAFFWWVKDARRLRALPVDPAVDPWMPEAERQSILEAVLAYPPLTDSVPTRQGGSHSNNEEQEVSIAVMAEHSPTYRANALRQEELYTRCKLSPAEVKKRMNALLKRADGTRAMSPAEWCHARGEYLERFKAGLYAAGLRLLEESLSAPRPPRHTVRTGTSLITTFNADKPTIQRARRKRGAAISQRDEDARALFLLEDYEPLSGYEKVVLIALANIAWDEGLLEGVPAARASTRIIDLETLANADDPQRVVFRFPGYAELARRAGAPVDAEGRVPQNFTRAVDRAFRHLHTEARWISEKVLVRRGKSGPLKEEYAVRKTLWVEVEALRDAKEVLVRLHPAACTSLLHSYIDRPNMLGGWETARKAIGAPQLRDDFLLCEDYLRYRLQAKKAKAPEGRSAGEVPSPASGATEADRRVVVEVRRELLWEKMGWDAIAKNKGRRAAEGRERDAFAFCKALGLLHEWEERDGQTGRVLVLTLSGSDHMDPMQGTLFLPEAEV